MSIFDNLSKTVGNAATTAAKKSGEMIETTKINVNISKEEDSMNKIYREIGKKFYESNGESTENAEYAELFEQIRTHKETIDGLKEKLNQIGE